MSRPTLLGSAFRPILNNWPREGTLTGVEIALVRPSAVELLDGDYLGYFADLVRLCRALGAGPDAEDIAQEVLLFAKAHAHQVRDPERLRGWLRTIAARRTMRAKARDRTTVLQESAFSPADPDLHIDLATAIVRLPRGERNAVTLVYGLGYSQDEAAAVLGLRRGTIAAALFHARAKLASWLLDYRRDRQSP